jgi:hypothetical protein
MANDNQKAFNAMDYLKKAKDLRKQSKEHEQKMTEFITSDMPTLFEQQKINAKEIEEGQISNDQLLKEVQELYTLEKYNAASTNLDDPFDVKPKKYIKQSKLFALNKKTYPIMYMTHVAEPLSNYCVLNINAYTHDLKDSKKVVFIDPGINELTKDPEYSHLDYLHRLCNNNLPKNYYISIDYPPDVNLAYSQLYIEKSIKNNFRYADNPQYICCIQAETNDIEKFKYRFNELSEIFLDKKKVIGIGCLHMLQPCEYSDAVINCLLKNADKIHWVHFYGVGMTLLKLYLPQLQAKGIRVSFDSTKYRFAVNEWVKKNYGLIAGKFTAPIFYYSYIKEMLSVPLDLIW